MNYPSELEENLKRGILEMLILKMLSDEDMYVYQMTNEMNERGQGLIDIKEGSLYGPIYRLVDKKYISETRVLVGKRRTRVYYHLESTGMEYLRFMQETYAKITQGVTLIMDNISGGDCHAKETE